jgi:hypothetical protein
MVAVVVEVVVDVSVDGGSGVSVPVGWVVTGLGVGVDVGDTQATNSEARSKIISKRLIGSPNLSICFSIGKNGIKILEKAAQTVSEKELTLLKLFILSGAHTCPGGRCRGSKDTFKKKRFDYGAHRPCVRRKGKAHLRSPVPAALARAARKYLLKKFQLLHLHFRI